MYDLRKPHQYRSIEALSQVRANGRILNLRTLSASGAHPVIDRGEERPGLFRSQSLNNAIVIKHNIRDNERALFDRPLPIATKIIFPVDPKNLSVGGAAFMLGERQSARILNDRLGLSRNNADEAARRDLSLLEVLDGLATFDPFILRERFAIEGVSLPKDFAPLQHTDDGALVAYMRSQLLPLVGMALGKSGNAAQSARGIERLVDEMFSQTDCGRPDLLREALKVSEADWPRALYTWKAALFYEFRVRAFEGRFQRFFDSLSAARFYGFTNQAPPELVLRVRVDFADRAARTKQRLDELLATFDQAYRKELIGDGRADSFRDYLLSLQDRLFDFGVVFGVLEQMVGYWEYWFISRGLTAIPAEMFLPVGRDLIMATEPARLRLSAPMREVMPETVPERPGQAVGAADVTLV